MKVKYLGIEFNDKELAKAMKIAKKDIKNDKGNNSLQNSRKVSDRASKNK